MIELATKDIILGSNIQYINGVGEKRAEKFKRLGIVTLKDAILCLPRAYEDRTQVKNINELIANETCTVRVSLHGECRFRKVRNGLSITNASFYDDTGMIQVLWFNAPYVKNQIAVDTIYALFGKVTFEYGKWTMKNPKIIDINKNELSILPIYPLTKKVKQHEIRKIILSILKRVSFIEESLPNDLIERNELLSKTDAIKQIHEPDSFDLFFKARKRLVFEELFFMQLALLNLKKEEEIIKRERKYSNDSRIHEFVKSLPYELTQDQKKALREIYSDFESEKYMHRLVQGDVGSGKTIVAIISALKVIYSNYQVAMMVPTSVLAMQQYEDVKNLLSSFNINVGLLQGQMPKKEKEKVLEGISDGTIQFVIGTHALIQENVSFHSLGFIITDEQHRFGVMQRQSLKEKSYNPDILVMSATPIPRTLALMIYADMDVSLIRQLPPGRKKVQTYVVDEKKRKRIEKFVVKQLDEGRQVYIICPLVEENEEMDLKAVEVQADKWAKGYLKNYRVNYVHGKMKSKNKEKVLSDFSNHDIDVLVSTTVVEVGVNVPNANLMIIENAERYGLSQLHQLRGRVGRGEYQSYCILFNESRSKKSKERLQILASSNDGFEIAEADLGLRGPGDFFGTMQHGIPDFKVANLYTDMPILKLAQKEAMICSNQLDNDDENLINKTIEKMKKEILDA